MKIKFLLAALALTLISCTSSKKEVWIYTSVYKEVIALYEPELKRLFPDIQIKWYQGGSENVSSKILAELSGGKTKADILMTSDLFFYYELKKKKLLKELKAEDLKNIPTEEIDADRMFANIRYPLMLLAVNKNVPEKDRPKSFKDLTKPQYAKKLTMPSPLESGTALTAALYLHELYGESYFKDLRKNEVLATGGNGAVFSRLQSGERPIGIVLLENILQGKEKGNHSVEYIIPSEGVLPIPSPIALLNTSKNPELAEKLVAWFTSPEAGAIISKGWLHSPIASVPAPTGAPEFKDIKKAPHSLDKMNAWVDQKQKIKDLFQNTVLK